MARENARQIRDVITSEMWEQINSLYWSIQEGEVIWHQPKATKAQQSQEDNLMP